MIYNSIQLDISNPTKLKEENVQSTPHGKLILGENAFRVTGIYSSASKQVHQFKTPLCSELAPKKDLKLYRNYYDGINRLS